MYNGRIIIADNCMIVLNGLHYMFDKNEKYDLVGETCNGNQLIKMACELKPDIIITDIKIAERTGLEVSQIIKEKIPQIKIIIFTDNDSRENIRSAIDIGVDAYIKKSASTEELLTTIDLILNGSNCIFPNNTIGKLNMISSFTGREMEIFRLMARNYSNCQIADMLFITEATVKSHVSSILRKTGQTNRAQAVLYGVSKGILDFDSCRHKSIV